MNEQNKNNYMEKQNLSSSELENQARKTDLEKKLNSFTDVDGISTRSLSFGLWYMEHRRTFFLAAVWSLSILATVLWVYSLYFFGFYLLVGLKNDRANNEIITENPLALEQRKVMSNVSYGFTQAISLGKNSYSLVGEFTNNNAGNWAIFDYYFLVGDQQYGAGTSYALFGERKYITGVVDDLPQPPNAAKLIVSNFRWNKLDRHAISDWETYKNDHLDFLVLDKKFVGAGQSSLSDRLSINTLSFNITNRTAYGYLQAPLQIILYSGSEVVYVKDYIINNFRSKDKKDISLTIVGDLPNINRIEVVPNVNILDETNFLNN